MPASSRKPGSPPRYFATPAAWRRWLERHHATAAEIVVGFHKRSSGRPSITWPESVDEALCFGWIDGIRRRVDDERYTIRFTPRRPRSIWSLINVRRMAELERLGKVAAAGRAAFAKRSPERTGIYGSERRDEPQLPLADAKRFRAARKAWAFFESQPPSYRRVALHWVTSAKREETRQRRLKQLIDDSAAGLRIGLLRRPGR